MALHHPRRPIAGVLILALALGTLGQPAWGAGESGTRGYRRPMSSPARQRGLARTTLLLGLTAAAVIGLTKCAPLAEHKANPSDWTPDGCIVATPQYELGKAQGGPWLRARVVGSLPGADLHVLRTTETGVGVGHPADSNWLSKAGGSLGGFGWTASPDNAWVVRKTEDLVLPKGGCPGAGRGTGKIAFEAVSGTLRYAADGVEWLGNTLAASDSPLLDGKKK
jgi:hypothetical protein